MRTFLPGLIERGAPGHILDTASAAGLAVFPERSSGYTYHASKFAVIGLTEALHRGLADEGRPIGAGVLIPGMVATTVAANSVRWAPPESSGGAAAALERTAARGDAAPARFGRDVDSVGEMAVEGIRQGRLYVPTNRLAEGALVERTRAVVAAMPRAHAADDALGRAMRGRSR